MIDAIPKDPEEGSDPRVFSTTHWSVVLAARDGSSAQSEEALGKLFKSYYYPVYSYLRRRGSTHHEAEDQVQGFFEKLISRDLLRHLSKERGKFRAFLLTALKSFLHDEWDKTQAQKRGGGRVILSYSDPEAEGRYLREPVDAMSPDKLYERQWIRTMLDRVLGRLAEEFTASGKIAQFELLKGYLTGERGGGKLAEAASRMGMTENALKVAVHRLRQRYGELFREEISQTVAAPEDLKEELGYLRSIMSE